MKRWKEIEQEMQSLRNDSLENIYRRAVLGTELWNDEEYRAACIEEGWIIEERIQSFFGDVVTPYRHLKDILASFPDWEQWKEVGNLRDLMRKHQAERAAKYAAQLAQSAPKPKRERVSKKEYVETVSRAEQLSEKLIATKAEAAELKAEAEMVVVERNQYAEQAKTATKEAARVKASYAELEAECERLRGEVAHWKEKYEAAMTDVQKYKRLSA